LVGFSVGFLVGFSVGFLVGFSVGFLVGFSVGFFVDFLVVTGFAVVTPAVGVLVGGLVIFAANELV